MSKGKANKRYSGEFKQEAIERMMQEHLSYRETARIYAINDHKRLMAWERIYLEEGAGGLYADRRGRKSTGRPNKLPQAVEEDLLAEVQRLRMENEYLKKLNALVQKRVVEKKKLK